MSDLTHYEVFFRKTAKSAWTLDMASEDRAQALEHAEELFSRGNVVGVKVYKEVMDETTNEYRSVSILSKGTAEDHKKKGKDVGQVVAFCGSPQDLYTAVSRETIARLLDDWFKRNGVTPFELLHRPDLVEKLEASGTEIQHALQKLSIPEAQETGKPVHELIRRWRDLADRACERVIRDGRKKLFPTTSPEQFRETAESLHGNPDRAYIMGGAIAAYLGEASRQSKLDRLLDLMDAAPTDAELRKWVVDLIEQPIVELFSYQGSIAEIVALDPEPGAMLSALTRLAASEEIRMLVQLEPRIGGYLPSLNRTCERLSQAIESGQFPRLSKAIIKRILKELNGPKRLRPYDPEAEIETLRVLAMVLSAISAKHGIVDDVSRAFIDRSKSLVSADFVQSLIGNRKQSLDEVQSLIWLCENVAGGANKRQAARWLTSSISATRFEREVRASDEKPLIKLATLAKLQKRVRRIDLQPRDIDEISGRLGLIGQWVEDDTGIVTQVLRSSAPPAQKLLVLMRMAAGEAAPLGPISERVRPEALKLLRHPQMREALGQAPQVAAEVKGLMAQLMPGATSSAA